MPARSWILGDPANIPNSDCRQAIENPGDPSNPQLPFTQWNELSANPTNPSIQATVELAVPNGLLCAGGDPRKAGLDNVPATKWRKTLITPDEMATCSFVGKIQRPITLPI